MLTPRTIPPLQHSNLSLAQALKVFWVKMIQIILNNKRALNPPQSTQLILNPCFWGLVHKQLQVPPSDVTQVIVSTKSNCSVESNNTVVWIFLVELYRSTSYLLELQWDIYKRMHFRCIC